VRRPTTFRELADLTYAATNLVDMADASPPRTLREPRGLHRSAGPSRSKLDTLSYVGLMPLEQVVIDVNSDHAERHFSGTGRLVALQDSMRLKLDSHLVSRSFGIPTE
jgi:hypothetical protein